VLAVALAISGDTDTPTCAKDELSAGRKITPFEESILCQSEGYCIFIPNVAFS
jgi:hypothetical protein